MMLTWPADAQMVLPGAVAPSPVGSTEAPRPSRPRRTTAAAPDDAPAHRPPLQIVPPAGLAGKTLSLNGGLSKVTFELHGKDVDVAHLTLTGELVTNSRETCKIEASNMPIAVTDAGHPAGVERLQLGYPACPIAFDVLEGAALVRQGQAVCEVKEANCRFNPVGLWGPQPADLGPDKAKSIEHARALAEAAVRANYKALVASTKDRPTIMGWAKEQAQFSSTREEICRDYAGEGRHGYCATKLTEARAAMLRAMLGDAVVAKADRKAKKRTAKGAKPGQG